MKATRYTGLIVVTTILFSATPVFADILWQSVPTHADEITLYSGLSSHPFYNGTQDRNPLLLGTWDGADFVTTANTTLHVWMRSYHPINSTLLDIGLVTSSGGNPFVAPLPTTTRQLIAGFPGGNFILTGVAATADLQEYTFPLNPGTIHHGDELWAYLYPAFATANESVFLGGASTTPQFQICEGECIVATTTTPQIAAPVIIIPGIMESGERNGVWVIEPILHLFDNLIDTLDANGYEVGVNLFTFPYDWHKSNVDTALLLKQKIDVVKAICHCDKVDLVAHSMGGLVARQYIQSTDYQHDVRKLIFLGTPHLGAPKMYPMWEAGELPGNDLLTIALKAILEGEAIEHGYVSLFSYIHSTPVPSVQQLLPIYNYLQNVGTYPQPRSDYPNEYPRNTFLETLSGTITNLYSSGVEITNFVGLRQSDSTIVSIRVTQWPLSFQPVWKDGYPENYFNFFSDQGLNVGQGDGTVPLASASFINQNVKYFNSEHSQLPTDTEADVFKTLTGQDATTIIRESPLTRVLFVRAYSPIDFQVVAPDGKRVGKDFGFSQDVSEIAGAFYTGFNTIDEVVTIPNPISGEYKVVTQGVGTGGKYSISVGVITDATSSNAFFAGQTVPGLITEHNARVDVTNPSDTKITPKDNLAPEIFWSQPATTTYTHAEYLPVNVRFSDTTGVSTTTVTFDTRNISASTTIDLFFETLGHHTIVATATDFVGNATSSTRTIKVIATLDSTKSDVNRAYSLKWINKDLRDDLLGKLKDIADTKKRGDRIQKLNDMLKTLSDARRDAKRITAEGYAVLVADINWLITSF